MDSQVEKPQSFRVVPILLVITAAFVGCGGVREELVNGFGQNGNIDRDIDLSIFGLYAATSNRLSERLVQTQNSDGGWCWSKTPEQLEAGTADPTENANMFGAPAVGLVDYYNRRPTPTTVAAIERTAQYLMSKPLSETQRLFVSDCEFLIKAGIALGKPEYKTKGEFGFALEKRFLAAVNIYGINSPTQAQINALSAAQIDSVTPALLAQTARTRLINSGRNAGLRAYDWASRLRVAELLGDAAFHRAMATVVANDYASISKSQWYFLVGIAATIVNLSKYSKEPPFFNVIQDASIELLSLQKTDGWFSALSDDHSVEHASIQDQGYVVRALLARGETLALAKLLEAVKKRVGSRGNLVEVDGNETPLVSAEMLSSFSLLP